MDKLARLREGLGGVADCALINDDVNRRYFTGMKSSAGVLLVFPEEAVFVIDFRYIEKARQVVRGCTVVLQEQRLYPQLARIIKEHGASSVAIDSQTCTVLELGAYQRMLGAQVVYDNRFGAMIRRIRMVKDPDEVDRIIKAQRIAEAGLAHMMEFIRAGRTEKEIQLELDYYMLSHGAEALSFDTIALSGPNTSLPHGVPSGREVQQGEFVLMDFGAVYEGYHSDMTRTVCVGEPTDRMREVYEIVLRAQNTAIAGLRAGISGKAFDAIARDIIAEAGYGEYFGHSLGHGVGMEIHEEPYGSPTKEAEIPEGAVITIEPGIYLEGEFGVRIEDFAYVTADGCRNLTEAPKELIVI